MRAVTKKIARFVATIASVSLLATAAHILQNDCSKSQTEALAQDSFYGGLSNSALVLLGGFRGILSEVVWFQADRLEAEGEYSRLAQVAAAMTNLEPHTPEVWAYAAWNLTFNVSASMPTQEERWRWVQAGLKLLQNDASMLNPGDGAIAKAIAEMYLIKIAANLDDAAEYYRSQLKLMYEKHGASAFGMKDSVCREIERIYGAQDWSSAESIALYYAATALPNAKGRLRESLMQQIFQSLIFQYQSDPAKKPYLIKALDALRKEFPAPYLDDCAKSLAC